MQHPTPDTDDVLSIRTTHDREQAVFVTRSVRRGEVLGLLTGPVLAERTRYTIERDGRFHDPVPPIRFVNHSCEPSAAWDGHELRALHPLDAGAEVTFDYLQTETDIVAGFECLCGSGGCRGEIRSESARSRRLQTTREPANG